MQYNTEKKELHMPEYGRHIQKLVDYAKTIENPEDKKDVIAQILRLMASINPNAKNVADYEHKLWDHLFIISDFELECESPFPVPTREEVFRKPEKFAYPNNKIKHKHYGKNVENMIKKAAAMEDNEKQVAYTELIASFMKRTYENYHNEGVNDEIIKEDLVRMSANELSLDDDKRIFVKRKGGKRITNRRNNNNGKRTNNRRKTTSRNKRR